jgi:rSAM/selenodomain-associated transferase 2
MTETAQRLISIVVPVLDDAIALGRLFDDLDAIDGLTAQRVVVDGGSTDESHAIARARADVALRSAPGRAVQIGAGVAASDGAWIWMLHADTRVSANAWKALERVLRDGGASWGRFDVELDAIGWPYRMIGASMNLRSRATGICTGDQGIFVRRDLLDAIGGMPQQPLMEDIELCRRLRRRSRPLCIDAPLMTSARRWQRRGIIATILLMWRLRLQYYLGVSPDALERVYYDGR